MEWSNTLSIAAIGISIGGLLWNILWAREERRRSTHYANSTLLTEVELSLKDIPGALKFRGISDCDLEKAGVSADELSFLTANILAGWMLYDILEPTCREPFAKGTYRYKLLQSEHTQRAWPLVKRLLEDCPYSERIENTILAIKKNDDTIIGEKSLEED